MGHNVLEDSVVQRTEHSAEPEHSDCSKDSSLCSDTSRFVIAFVARVVEASAFVFTVGVMLFDV